jgi:hypothetical protein
MTKFIIISFSIILVLVTILLSASGIFLKRTYLNAWAKDYYQNFDDVRLQLVAHGILAANGHNMQPWKIELDNNENVFFLFLDSAKLTPEVDPFARQSLITQGTFLEYVKIAGDKLGYSVDIQLFPNGEYDENNLAVSMDTLPVAKITIAQTTVQNNPLYDYMFLQDTNRGAYTTQTLTAEQVAAFEAINNSANLSFRILQDAQDVANLSQYCFEATSIEANNEAVFEETAQIIRFNEYAKNKYAYGFSMEGQGKDGFMKHIMQGVITLFPFMNTFESTKSMTIEGAKAVRDNTSVYATINSQLNTRTEQVEAGMLYSRMVLYAHSLGFVMQPMSQALQEYEEMQTLYNNIHAEYANPGETIQMLIRIGVAQVEYSQSMRQDVSKFIK